MHSRSIFPALRGVPAGARLHTRRTATTAPGTEEHRSERRNQKTKKHALPFHSPPPTPRQSRLEPRTVSKVSETIWIASRPRLHFGEREWRKLNLICHLRSAEGSRCLAGSICP